MPSIYVKGRLIWKLLPEHTHTHTRTHTHTGAIALAGPLRWSINFSSALTPLFAMQWSSNSKKREKNRYRTDACESWAKTRDKWWRRIWDAWYFAHPVPRDGRRRTAVAGRNVIGESIFYSRFHARLGSVFLRLTYMLNAPTRMCWRLWLNYLLFHHIGNLYFTRMKIW